MVTRLIKWSVAEHNLPSDSFSIHSLRSGGATCLYHAGVDLEFIRRFGRWKSSTFSIYLHFVDKVLRKLSICLMESEGLMTQLKVCTDQGEKLEYARTGEQVRVTTQEPGGAESGGQPSSCPGDVRRTGGEYNPYAGYARKDGRSRSQSADSARSTTSNQEQKAVIDRAAQQNLRAAKALWDLIPHHEYADEDDGIDKLMTKEALYYAIQGQVFVDEAYCSHNFRVAKIQSRNARRARVMSGKKPAGVTTLGEYQQSYQKYMLARAANIQAAREAINKQRVVGPKGKKKSVGNYAAEKSADHARSSGEPGQDLDHIQPGRHDWITSRFTKVPKKDPNRPQCTIEVNVPFRARPRQARLPRPPRIPRRKCGCKRVRNNPLPWE